MNKKGSKLLEECKSDLRSIIRDLEYAQIGIKNDFYNIGNKECSDCLGGVINRYNNALNIMNSIDSGLLETLDQKTKNIEKTIVNNMYIL